MKEYLITLRVEQEDDSTEQPPYEWDWQSLADSIEPIKVIDWAEMK